MDRHGDISRRHVLWGHGDMGWTGGATAPCPQGPPLSLGGDGDMGGTWGHLPVPCPRGRDRQGDTGQTRGHHDSVSPWAASVPWGHGDMGWTRGHPDFMSSRATVGTQRDMGTAPSASPRVPHVRGGGHGDKGGHGDIRDPCPRRMWGHGAMGTPRIHVPRGSPCPRGTWGRGASVSPGVLQCPHGIWGHRVPWGRLGSVSPKVLRCPRGTRGHPRSASPGVLCCPRGMRGHRVTWGPLDPWPRRLPAPPGDTPKPTSPGDAGTQSDTGTSAWVRVPIGPPVSPRDAGTPRIHICGAPPASAGDTR